MGVTGASPVTPNDPFHEEANVLGVWRWGALRNAYSYEEVSTHTELSLQALLFIFIIRISLFITKYLPNKLTNF